MLKYAIILLDRTSVAFCHADNPYTEPELMPLETLKEAIFWAMKENLTIQFVYPDRELPEQYIELIDTIDHVDIRPDSRGDACVFNRLNDLPIGELKGKNVVVRIPLACLLKNDESILQLLENADHVSAVITDVASLTDDNLTDYKKFLSSLSDKTAIMYSESKTPQINILTDRMMLDSMNNCNAGWESITIAPNGRFYLCPAFYYQDENDSAGSLAEGLDIRNQQLLRLEYAPICRRCDAYQCRRCVWLNRKTTLEVNTPSREQCVSAHIERNASKLLLESIRKHCEFLPDKKIKEIDYLDPFEEILKKN